MMMDFLDNEYKKRFKNHVATPEDLDAEALWSAIAEGLDNNQPTPKTPINRFQFFKKSWLWGGALTLLFIIILTNNYDSQKTEHQENINTNTTTEKNTSNNNKNDYTTPKASETVINGNNNISVKDNSTHFEASNLNPIFNNPILHNYVSKYTAVIESQMTPSPEEATKNIAKNGTATGTTVVESIHSSSFQKDSLYTYHSEPNQTATFTDNPIAIEDSSKSISHKTQHISNYFNIAPIEQIQQTNVTAQFKVPFLVPKLDFTKELTAKNNGLKSSIFNWESSLITGANFTKISYSSSNNAALATQKSQTEHLQMGMTSALNMNLILKKHWSIGTGIAYHQLWSKFEGTQQKSSTELKQNQLLKVWIDAKTGQVLKTLYGDTTIKTVTTREVRHYNQFKQYSIPIHIGYQTTHRNILYGISTGIALNFITSQTGKGFDNNGNIIAFKSTDTIAPFKKQTIGFYLGTTIGYQWHKHFIVTLAPVWQYQKNRQSDFTAHIHQFNFNIGLTYKY